MSKTKICRGCYRPFIGRRDARTCSARCRKRVQRARELLLGEMRPKVAMLAARPAAKQVAPISRSSLIQSIGWWLGLGSLLLLFLSSGRGLALSQGYTTSDNFLKQGMAVTLSSGDSQGPPAVQSAAFADADKVVGIVVGSGDSLVTSAPAGSRIYVAESGQAKAYVSDLNGQVKQGDLLTLSPLKGILMRASSTAVPTVGTALENFSAAAGQSVSATDASGKSVKSRVALININVDIQPASAVPGNSASSLLQNLSVAITGRNINGIRILSALAIFSTLLVIEGEIIYGTITSSITALGRNPLARGLVGWQSLRSVTIAGLILVFGIAAIAMLLWL